MYSFEIEQVEGIIEVKWFKSDPVCEYLRTYVLMKMCFNLDLENWIFNFNYIFIYLKSRSGLSLLIWFTFVPQNDDQICPVCLLRAGNI